MNKKGFGFSEVFAFIGLSMFILVVLSIYIHRKFGSNIYNSEPAIEESRSNAEPINISKPSEYLELEFDLKEAAKKYNFDDNKDTVITLKQLQEKGLIGELIDPNDKNIKCDGYVLYTISNENYQPNISCMGMYTTSSYDSNLLK